MSIRPIGGIRQGYAFGISDPRDSERLRGEIEELFSDLWQLPLYAAGRRQFRPHVDCFRTGEPPALTVVVELPGVDPADVRLDATPTALRVSGERRRPRDAARVYERMEIAYGRFERTISLANPVDAERASAEYANGLLTIVLPIAERRPQPLTVAIDVGGRT